MTLPDFLKIVPAIWNGAKKAWEFLQSHRTLIRWNVEGDRINFQHVGGPEVPGSLARSLDLSGRNVSAKPIHSIDGFIKPDLSADRFQLHTVKDGYVVATSRIVELPPNETIEVVGFFGNDIDDYAAWRGISADLFIARYTPFTVVLTIDGHKVELRFTRERCKAMLDRFIAQSFKPHKGPIIR